MKVRAAFSVLAGAFLLLGAAPALAHHSFAMFDGAKTVTYKGVVKEVQWTNPHVWLELNTADAGGKTLSFEGGAISVLKRAGWMRETVKAGDLVTITSHPFKNGRPGGSLESAILPDGKTLIAGNAIPGALVVESARP